MAIVITKKTRTILLIILAVLVVGGGGFLIWRVTREEPVSPTDSDAACPSDCQYYGGGGNAYICQDGNPATATLGNLEPGCYKVIGETGSLQCYKPCSTSPDPDVSCETRVSSDTSKPIGSRCLNKGSYSYECGVYCYLESNGARCCGTEGPPDYCIAEYPDYNSLPYTTTAATQKSELILYYRVIPPYTSLAQFVVEDPDGTEHTINVSSTQARIETGIVLEKGETAKVKTVYETAGGKTAVGWQSVNSGNTCGSGAMGPIQNNDCTRYQKKDVSSYISWANSSSDETLISRQCWADAKEWEGDYDFEDFFVQLYYLPIDEPTCGNGVIDTGEDCDTGITGEGGQCQGDGETVACPSTCVCPVINQTNPDWTIVKNVESEYVVVNEENFANVDYTVTVTNVGDGEGSIDKIVDELDQKVLEDYIQEMSNSGLYSSGSITWDLEGEDEVFSPDENLELTYSFQIPESAYGTYQNIVTAYPTEGDNFSDDARIVLVSDDEPTTVPQTGLFDTVLARISLGMSFIFLGGLVSQYSKFNYFLNSISEKYEFRNEIRKQKRANRRRKRLEDRFKDS